MIKKNELPFLILAILFIAFCVFLLLVNVRKVKSLERNSEYTNAVILDFSFGSRGRYYLDYDYFVNGKEYHGSGKYYPGSDLFSVGDTIEIVYDRTNSDSSMPLRDYENSRYEKPFIIPTFIFIGLLIWWVYRKK